jgi:hypothetical protein
LILIAETQSRSSTSIWVDSRNITESPRSTIYFFVTYYYYYYFISFIRIYHYIFIIESWLLQVSFRVFEPFYNVLFIILWIVFILDLKGKVLISRNYRGDIPMSAVEKFMPLVIRKMQTFSRENVWFGCDSYPVAFV